MQLLSALMDGELAPAEAERALAVLAGAGPQASWRAWQLIGEVLRNNNAGADTGPAAADPAFKPAPAEALP